MMFKFTITINTNSGCIIIYLFASIPWHQVTKGSITIRRPSEPKYREGGMIPSVSIMKKIFQFRHRWTLDFSYFIFLYIALCRTEFSSVLHKLGIQLSHTAAIQMHQRCIQGRLYIVQVPTFHICTFYTSTFLNRDVPVRTNRMFNDTLQLTFEVAAQDCVLLKHLKKTDIITSYILV